MLRNNNPSQRRFLAVMVSFLGLRLQRCALPGWVSWIGFTVLCSSLLLRFHEKPAPPYNGQLSPLNPNLSDLWPWLKRMPVTPEAALERKLMSASFFGRRLPLSEKPSANVLSAYPHLAMLERQFFDLVQAHPQLAHLEKIGESTSWRQPLWAIRLSDHPDRDEDEPTVLFTGMHHAREPVGTFICQTIMETLLTSYGKNPRYTRLVDSLEIWLVPIVNPDGYEYIVQNQLQFPWWRKNLRDNNNDGIFDPVVDGVDLNRNYDFNWDEGGDGNPASWFYRGGSPFSEKEIQALRDLAWRENFLIGASFHSYGESVLYPWGNYHRAPDQDLIIDIARRCAEKIGRLSGHGAYNVLPLNGRVGQSSIWMYGELGAMDYIIETGEAYFAEPEDIPRITGENLQGALFLLQRALGSGVTGHVRDRLTGKPLAAEIHISGTDAVYVKCRRSDARYGRFDRLLFPGQYTLEVRAPNYKTEIFPNLQIQPQARTAVEIALLPQPATLLPSAH